MLSKIEKVAVVGGAGYLGNNLCLQLVNGGLSVVSLDTHWFGDDALHPLRSNPAFTSKKVDICTPSELLPLLRGCDAVVWVAGLVGDPACDLDVEFTYKCNYHSVLTLAHICKWMGIPRFVFASSCSVYGRCGADVQHLTEDSPARPLSCYAQDKLACEKALRAMADDGFHPTILRLSTLYGWSKRMRFDLVVNVLTARACKGETLEISGGGQRRPFLHVKDATAAFVASIQADVNAVSGQVFNVGADAGNHRIIDIAHFVASAVPSSRLKFLTNSVDQRDYDVDFSKIARRLAFKASYSVPDGIQEMQQKLNEENCINLLDPLYSNERRTRQLLAEAQGNGGKHRLAAIGLVDTAA